jgi:predicted ATPase
MTGFVETGTRLMEEAVAHDSRGDNPHSLAWALGVAAHAFQVVHAPAMTARFATKAIKVARENRLPQWLAAGERCNGWVIHRLGDREAGLNLQHVGVNRWYETGARLHTTHCEIALAESYLVDGEVTAAGKHLAAARAHRTSHDENYLAAEIQRLEALLLLREGAPFAIVREHLTKGIGIAYQQGARTLELRCATTLAHLLAEKGEHREARDLLAPVYGWFTEGFDIADLKEAKALLDEPV